MPLFSKFDFKYSDVINKNKKRSHKEMLMSSTSSITKGRYYEKGEKWKYFDQDDNDDNLSLSERLKTI